MTVTAQVEAKVRSAVRSTGIDPLTDPGGVRDLVDQAIGEVLADLLVADRDVRIDAQAVAEEVLHSVAGFGPLQRFFDDPTCEEVWINEPGRVFVARGGRSELTTVVLSEREVRDLVERMLRVSGRRLDLSQPFVDAMLPDGSRLHVVIPDITHRHWAVNIRRFILRPRHVDDLVPVGTLSAQAARFLAASVVSGLSIVIAGGTQSGKTTLLNGLLGCIPSGERIVSCEEVFELQVAHPDHVAMQTRDASLEGVGEIPLRRLVKEALRMRPTRLIVGEVRQAEALDLLIAMNSGMPAMATIHANSAREAVTKLCTLPLLAGQNIPGDFVVPTVASSVDLVVHTATERDGQRRVREICALPGRVEGGIVEMATVFADRGDGLAPAGGFPGHEERYARAGYDLARLLGNERWAA